MFFLRCRKRKRAQKEKKALKLFQYFPTKFLLWWEKALSILEPCKEPLNTAFFIHRHNETKGICPSLMNQHTDEGWQEEGKYVAWTVGIIFSVCSQAWGWLYPSQGSEGMHSRSKPPGYNSTPFIPVCICRSPLPQPYTFCPAFFGLPTPTGHIQAYDLPLGSDHRQPLLQQLQQLQHSSVETCCVDLHRQRQGWSALHSCPRGAPCQRGQGMGQALPGASSGQLLQGNMPCVMRLTIRSNLTSDSSH